MPNKPWLASYPPGVPETIPPLAHASLLEFFQQSISRYPQRPAFSSGGRSLSYGELDNYSARFAGFLRDQGARPGERAAIMLPNLLQYPIAVLGVLRAGLVVVNTNPLYTARELKYQLQDSGAETVVVLEQFAQVLAAIQTETPVKRVIVAKASDLLPFFQAHLVDLYLRYIKHAVPDYQIPGAIPFKRVLQAEPLPASGQARLGWEDLAFLQYTGGTTGLSKGAMLSHGNLLSNISQATIWISHGNPPGKALQPGREVIITALPLYHIFSLTANFLVFFGLGAENVLIADPRDRKTLLHTLKNKKFTCITGVNTFYERLMDAPGFDSLDFSCLKIALAGGMATRPETAQCWQRLTGNTLIESYGLTEASPAVAINPLDSGAFSGSIGLPLPSTECEIRDDSGAVLPAGAAGELFVCGPQIMRGYWGAYRESAKQLAEGGWLSTGDMAYIGEGGYLYLKDRKKDMILVSGFNVYPSEIEVVVNGHSDVLECCALGVADSHTGEAVKLVVVSRNPALTADQLIAYCRQYLAAYKIPRIVEFRQDLPKSAMGKVLRRALKT